MKNIFVENFFRKKNFSDKKICRKNFLKKIGREIFYREIYIYKRETPLKNFRGKIFVVTLYIRERIIKEKNSERDYLYKRERRTYIREETNKIFSL